MKNDRVVIVLGLCCSMAAGAQVTLLPPLETGPTAAGLSPPILNGASNCSKTEWRVALRGGRVGDVYEINESLGNPVVYAAPLVEVPVSPNLEGVTIADVVMNGSYPNLTARIRTPAGIYSGFAVPLFLRDPDALPDPEIPFVPLWECGNATLVSGHQPGDRLELFSSLFGTRNVVSSAFGTHDYMPIGSVGGFKAGEIITTQYATCEGQPSPVSQQAIVAVFPMSVLDAPELRSESLSVGVSRFVVDWMTHGATLHLSLQRGGNTSTWTESCATPNCTAFIPSSLGALEEGDFLEARQELCPGTQSAVVQEEVKQCGDTALPVISPAPNQGDTFITLAKYPLGANVRVYATPSANPTIGLTLIGYAHDVNPVPLARAVAATDRWIVVAVDTPGCNAQSASGFFVGQ